jgi:hypothetical protein
VADNKKRKEDRRAFKEDEPVKFEEKKVADNEKRNERLRVLKRDQPCKGRGWAHSPSPDETAGSTGQPGRVDRRARRSARLQSNRK